MNIELEQTLTPQEKEIFELIRNLKKKVAPNTTVRVCGGWVRDKIMGLNPHDIDCMVDNMSGEQFAKLLTKSLNLNDPHVIRENPDASKHVETAKVYLPLSDGTKQEIDFVQARKEVYRDNSRIPDVKPATPQEDALRRDLTINSLFYNLDTKQVEDFSGKGIRDLITKTIRTSVDPLQTFMDDPLRMFRTIRFAAKYNYQIDNETLQALKSEQLRQEIQRKVSKERIKDEMTKMFSGPNPQYAMKLLKETGLFQDMINEATIGTKYQGKIKDLDMDQNTPHHELTLWDHSYQTLLNTLQLYPNMAEEKRVIIILSAIMHDLGKLFSDVHSPAKTHSGTSYIGHEKESDKISELILKYLKFENHTIEKVMGLTRYHMDPHRLADDANITAMRRFIRHMGEKGVDWMDVLNLSIADAYSKGLNIDPKTIEKYNSLKQKMQEAVQSMQMESTKVKPILNGNEVMQILGLKPGPYMKYVNDYIFSIMDENPNVSAEEMKNRISEIKMQAENLSKQNNIKVQDAIIQIVQNNIIKTAKIICKNNNRN